MIIVNKQNDTTRNKS